MNFEIITLFADYFDSVYQSGVVSRAFKPSTKPKNQLTSQSTQSQPKPFQIKTINPRDFSTDRHKSVDGSAYAGGAMVMRADVMIRAIDSALKDKNKKQTRVIHLSPSGTKLNQTKIKELTFYRNPTLLIIKFINYCTCILNHFGNNSLWYAFLLDLNIKCYVHCFCLAFFKISRTAEDRNIQEICIRLVL